ncbi:MAG: hypothetical protein ABJF88_10330 [Rhodothermales bacterium]
MNDLLDLATFRSGRFAPVLPEDSQVNPGCYGAELAYWLCLRLAERGVVTSYPDAEDWGWMLGYATDAGDEFALLCGNVDGVNDAWVLALRRFGRKLFGRDKPPFAHAEPLILALRAVLDAEETITALEWQIPTAS